MCLVFGIIALFVAILFIWFIYIIFVAIYRKITLRYETTPDIAEVVSKDYDDGFTMELATHTVGSDLYEEYNVYILYNGKQHCFESETLYKSVNVGDTVNILVHNGFNKNGELKHTYITIP